MNDQKHDFQYTYSAKEQEEIKRIRSKYLPKEESKMDQLRRLDAQVVQKATMYSLIIGVAGALTMGFGMSCCLVWTDRLLVPGIIAGVIGMTAAALAYPLYDRTVKKERKRVAPQILRLTEDLMK